MSDNTTWNLPKTSGIELVFDILNEVNPGFCRFLPLPNKESKSWPILLEIFDIFGEMDEISIKESPELEKMFVLYDFRKNDFRIEGLRKFYEQNKLPENDASTIYDLLRVSEKWFIYKYYLHYKDEKGRDRLEYQPEMDQDFDEARYETFNQKRQAFLEAYFRDIDFDQRFSMVREIKIGGLTLPINPNALKITGFDKWWTGPIIDNSSDEGSSEVLYIPTNPSIESLADFVRKEGMALWKILDMSFGKEENGLWDFAFSKESIFDLHSAGFFADNRRVTGNEFDVQYHTDIALVSKLTAHMAGLWDIARIVRYFELRQVPLLADAFRELYELRVERVAKALSGEDSLSSLATIPPLGEEKSSSIGSIPGYKEEESEQEIIDPKEKRLTKNLNIVDLSAIFSNPSNIQYLLNNSAGTEFAPITSFIAGFDRVTFKDEEDLERLILDIAYLPLRSTT